MSQGVSTPMRTEHLAQLDAIDQTYWWHRVRWRTVRQCMRQWRSDRSFQCYFDVGSGGGGLPGLLSRDFAFARVLLFDQHEAQATKLRGTAFEQRHVDLEAFDWQGVPSPDLITCLDVLEHLEDPARLLRHLRQASRATTPLLIVTVPAMARLWSRWDELAGHHRRYSRQELTALLRGAGWKVERCSYIFHSAVVPLLMRRKNVSDGQQERLEFPHLPRGVNAAIEYLFWIEHCATDWLQLPFGSSLVAVAQ